MRGNPGDVGTKHLQILAPAVGPWPCPEELQKERFVAFGEDLGHVRCERRAWIQSPSKASVYVPKQEGEF